MTGRMEMHANQFVNGTPRVLGTAVARQRALACVNRGIQARVATSASRGYKVQIAWNHVIGKLCAGDMGAVSMISTPIALSATATPVGVARAAR